MLLVDAWRVSLNSLTKQSYYHKKFDSTRVGARVRRFFSSGLGRWRTDQLQHEERLTDYESLIQYIPYSFVTPSIKTKSSCSTKNSLE
jgi:hypothetical protein